MIIEKPSREKIEKLREELKKLPRINIEIKPGEKGLVGIIRDYSSKLQVMHHKTEIFETEERAKKAARKWIRENTKRPEEYYIEISTELGYIATVERDGKIVFVSKTYREPEKSKFMARRWAMKNIGAYVAVEQTSLW